MFFANNACLIHLFLDATDNIQRDTCYELHYTDELNKHMNLTVLILAQCLIHRRLNIFLYLQRQKLVTLCCEIKTMN